jgi:hypothetical protein
MFFMPKKKLKIYIFVLINAETISSSKGLEWLHVSLKSDAILHHENSGFFLNRS